MQVEVTARHGQIRQDVHDYIVRKSEKLVTYFDRVTAIHVTVEFEHDRVEVEMQVDAEHKHDFVARHSGEDVPSTFDMTLHKMEQQIRRYKERIQDHRRAPLPGEPPEEEPSPEA